MHPLRDIAAPDAGSDLETRLHSCLEFALQTVRSADRSDPLWDVDLGEVTGHDKLLLEASLFAYIVGRGGHHEAATNQLLAAIRARYDSAHVLSVVRRQPVQVATLGATMIVLWQRGLATADEVDGLQRALSSQYVDATERVPFRLLDRRWILHVAGHGELVDHAAMASSAGCRDMHPIYMSREDAYAITHTVMYVTDFGAEDPPPHLSAGLRDTLDQCLIWCLVAHDYDLVAELLLARIYLCRSLGAVGTVAWRDCTAIWDELGFLPSPTLHADAFTALTTDAERTQYAHHHMYHTVLVAGLLCDAMSRLPTEPLPAEAPRAASYAGGQGSEGRERVARIEDIARAVRDRLSDVFDVPQKVAEEVIQRITPTPDTERLAALTQRWQQDGADPGLASLMAVEAGLIESARAHDLTALAGFLTQAARAGHASATVLVAADYLASQFTSDGRLADARPAPPATAAGLAAALSAPLAALAERWTRRAAEEADRDSQRTPRAPSRA